MTSRAVPVRHDRADQTRKNILRAAIREFSAHGLAGARTDTIAESAGVNKALLYYYFTNKSGLYEAAFEEIATEVAEQTLAALDPRHSPGERLLRAALNHFDRILTKLEFQSLLQQEMVRLRRGEVGTVPILVKKVFKPLLARFEETIHEGICSGELCDLDWLQVVYSILGANVFYFLSAPMMQFALPFNPLERSCTRDTPQRRSAVTGNSSLRRSGARSELIAKRVLADMPMPQIRKNHFGRKGL